MRVDSEKRLLCVMPSIPLGGMERAVLRLVKALMKRGYTAHFVLDRSWGTQVQAAVTQLGASWSGVSFVASVSRPRTLLEARLAARSIFRSAAEIQRAAQEFGPRQILATGLNNALMTRHVARTPSMRSVFRIGNPPGISRWKAKALLDRTLWRMVYEDYDALVCNSQYTWQRVAEMVGDDRRIRVIRNFMPEGRADRADAPVLDRSRINVVYLGQVSRAKGVDLLVQAALDVVAARGDVNFTIAGPDVWQDRLGDELRRRIQSVGAAARIQMIGPISDVQGLLRQADIHVCPSVSAGESFPNVVLDAKLAGVPSVVFPTAGLPEAIRDGVDGVVTARCDVEALTEALLAICADSAYRGRLAEGAAQSIQSHAPEALTDAWASLFGSARDH